MAEYHHYAFLSFSHSTANSETNPLSHPDPPSSSIPHLKPPPLQPCSLSPINPYNPPINQKPAFTSHQPCALSTPSSTPAATASRTKNGKAAPASPLANAAILTRMNWMKRFRRIVRDVRRGRGGRTRWMRRRGVRGLLRGMRLEASWGA